MIVITLSIKGFMLIPCVFLEKTRVFLKKRKKYNIFLNRGKTYKDPAFIPTINEGVF